MDIRSFFGSTKSSKDAPKPADPPKVASEAPISSPVKKPRISPSNVVSQDKSPMKSPTKATAKVNSSSVPVAKTSGSKKKRNDEFGDDPINLNDTDEDDAPTTTTQSRKRLKCGKDKEETVATSIASPMRASTSVKEPGSATKKRAPSSATAEPVKKQKLIDLEDDEDDHISAQTISAVKGKKPAPSAVPPPPVAAPKVEGLHFDDMKIAVSGTFQTTSREDIEEYIKERGGKISTAISGKTNFLVVGHILEDGREVTEGSKYRTATEKKIPILTEEEFFNKFPKIPIRGQSTATAAPAASMAVMNALNNEGKIKTMSKPSPSISASSTKPYSPGMYDLWVDKYRPTNPQDLVGHGDLVRRLSDWLRTWEGVHITKKLPKPPFSKENPGAKAVLISGPPGIGKTTVANIIAKQFQYEVLELNASDTRNKRELDEKLVEAVSSHAISSAFASSNNDSFSTSSSTQQGMKLQRRLVIMDEVDGMGGSDRGGVAELIKIIKISRVPIVCICNDRQSPKVKSLANHCYDLRVRRPMKAQIADRLVAIAAQEGLIVDKNAAEILVEQAGNDIRAALNALQMWAQATAKSQEQDSNRLGYTELKAGMSRIEKDKVLRLSPFDAALGLMAGEKAPWDERYNAFFVDYSLIPLLVQENYVDAAKSGIFRNPQLDDASKMEALCHAAEAASDMDLVGTSIRGADQHWELLPTQAIFCMRVGQPIVGFQAFPAFPSWLGKYSATGKKARLTREMVQHSSLSIGQGFVPIRLDYVPYLRNRLLQPLLTRNKDGCEETIQLLDEYGLTKDDFTESMREMQFILEKASTPAEATLKDKFEKLDTQTKSTLTRLYNSGSHTSMTIVQPLGLKGVKGKKKSSASLNEDGLEEWNEDEEAAAEEEPEEEEDVEALRAQLSKAAGKGAKSSARASAAGGGRGKAASGGGAAASKKKK